MATAQTQPEEAPRRSWEPTGDCLFVKPIEEGPKMYGSLHIPDIAKEKPNVAEVVAVGPGIQESGVPVPMPAKVGDYVLFGKYAGSTVEIDGEEVLILRAPDIRAVSRS